jgi:AraC-like DNA-binding protein
VSAAPGGRAAAENPGGTGRPHQLRLGPGGIIAAGLAEGTSLHFLGLNGAWCAISLRDAGALALTYLPRRGDLPPGEAVRLALTLLGTGAPPAPAAAPDDEPPARPASARGPAAPVVAAPGWQEESGPVGTAGERPDCPVCGSLAVLQPPPPPQPDADTRRRAREAERIARVITWMVKNSHRDDVTVGEVAEVIGVSVNRLQAIFRKEVGRRPLQLRRDIALYRAHLALTGQEPAYRAYFGQDPCLSGQTARNSRQHNQPEPETEGSPP